MKTEVNNRLHASSIMIYKTTPEAVYLLTDCQMISFVLLEHGIYHFKTQSGLKARSN